MFNHDDLPGLHALRYLRSKLRTVPDFPIPGILFKDITPLLADPRALAQALEQIALCSALRSSQAESLSSFLKKP